MSGIAIAGVMTAVGIGTSIYQGQQQEDASNKALQQTQANANKTAAQADQAFNQANQKRPDTAAILAAAQQAGKGGASGTMLTGPQGVDPSQLTLGKSTLLGS